MWLLEEQLCLTNVGSKAGEGRGRKRRGLCQGALVGQQWRVPLCHWLRERSRPCACNLEQGRCHSHRTTGCSELGLPGWWGARQVKQRQVQELRGGSLLSGPNRCVGRVGTGRTWGAHRQCLCWARAPCEGPKSETNQHKTKLERVRVMWLWMLRAWTDPGSTLHCCEGTCYSSSIFSSVNTAFLKSFQRGLPVSP